MRVATEIILNLSTEQELPGIMWPHPWDHYPFRHSGSDTCVWFRYEDLDEFQRRQVQTCVETVQHQLEQALCRNPANEQ